MYPFLHSTIVRTCTCKLTLYACKRLLSLASHTLFRILRKALEKLSPELCGVCGKGCGLRDYLLLFHLLASSDQLQSPRLGRHFGVSLVPIRFVIGELSEVGGRVGHRLVRVCFFRRLFTIARTRETLWITLSAT